MLSSGEDPLNDIEIRENFRSVNQSAHQDHELHFGQASKFGPHNFTS